MTSAVVEALRTTATQEELSHLMAAVTREMKFRYYALIHHDDLRIQRPDLVDLKDYPPAIAERLFGKHRYRRDPVIRGCIFADGAFLWSDLPQIIRFDRQDRASLEIGEREGLNEGITVPYVRLGHRMGSCTFAGTKRPDRAHHFLGAAQMVGIFAFQAASRLVSGAQSMASTSLKLHPRPRDCVVLAGRGYSNKEIARALSLTPRTVDGYLTEARRLFDAHDRTELVVGAVLAGEVGLHELARRQPE
ncbi:LuxR family transcriptional regulator [Tardibacter chloracetimidivorans]|uniref:LuxR family transcriptional regulator n=1 Tax=Tardibacter chloracetimidivorans TaxID=1921510 RepID=A0A1L4A053_9SPHN|nr:LuxR family transcriptional regulator [Tardibacter chloracetimidivorans]